MDDDDKVAAPAERDEATGYGVEELAGLGGVPVRTVRFYIAQGVLPGPGSRGRAATYGEEHLVRLRLIRRLAERRVPLAEMRALLAPLSLADARALLAEEEQHTATLRQAAQAPSPREYIATLLSRAQAARQPQGTLDPGAAGQEHSPLTGRLRAGAAGEQSPAGEQPLSGGQHPSIAQPPSVYVPRPLGPTPPASPPLRVPASKSSPRQQTSFPWRRSPPGNAGKDRSHDAGQSASAWRRWELAPGVELQVRAEVLERSRALIRRLLRAAGLPENVVESSVEDER